MIPSCRGPARGDRGRCQRDRVLPVRLGRRDILRALCRGKEHVAKSGPVILAPNRVSYLDPVIVGVATSRRVHFMARKELFRNPLVGWFLHALQAFPVTRERIDPSTLKRTLSLLAAGQVVLMFPEGTRGDGRTVRPAKPGIAVVAAEQPPGS